MLATATALVAALCLTASQQAALDYTSLRDSDEQCDWVRYTDGKQRLLAHLGGRCSEVRKIALNPRADRALVVLNGKPTPRLFRVDFNGSDAAPQPLPPLPDLSEAWFDLLFANEGGAAPPVLFTMARAKPKDASGSRGDAVLRVYALREDAWHFKEEARPNQTDESPGPVTEAYWRLGYARAAFDPERDEDAGPPARLRAALQTMCEKSHADGALWADADDIGLCWSYPAGGEGVGTFSGDGGTVGPGGRVKGFSAPELKGLSVLAAAQVQTAGTRLSVCGSRRIRDVQKNRLERTADGTYAVALWRYNWDSVCRATPGF